jgi:flagellar protein FlgJ
MTGAAGVDPVARAQERAALEKAARGFEAIFTRQLLSSMRSAGLGEGISDSSAVEQFQEMADANMADGLASKGGLGIAQLLLRQLDRQP